MSNENKRRYKRDTSKDAHIEELEKEYLIRLRRWERVKDAPSRPPKPKKPEELIKFEQAQKMLELTRDSKKDESEAVQVKAQETETQKMRRLLRERRRIVAPNGQEVYIPKHAAIEDIYKILSKEYGFSKVEISGIFATLKALERNPNFSGLINRVEAKGIEKPIRIVRPNLDEEGKGNKTNPTATNQMGYAIHREDPELEAARETFISEIWANKFREYSKQRREEAERRKESDQKLQEQLDKVKKEEERLKGKIPVAAIALSATLFLSGVAYLASVIEKTPFEEIMNPPNLTPLTTEASSNEINNNLFGIGNEVIAETISTPAPEVTIIPQPDDGFEYESFSETVTRINKISKGINENSRLYSAIKSYSKEAENPAFNGEISSYEEFEEALENNEEALYTSGPLYYASFARQVVRSTLRDKYNTERVNATYDKKGDTYEFYIRYYNGAENTPTSMDGKVKMTRNEEGRLQTSGWHAYPMEFYETLALIGEFSDYKMPKDDTVFDLNKYAAEHTNGDVEAAREELKSRMELGWKCISSIIGNRAREDRNKPQDEFSID